MAGVDELLTPPLVVEQQITLFGTDCTLRVEAGLEGTPGCARVYLGQFDHWDARELVSAHLPAHVERAFLDALYASLLTLPVMEIGRALHERGRV